MQARVHIHPAGSDWNGGRAIDAEGVSMVVAAGVTPPTLNFVTSLAQRPRPRLDQATLVIDGHPVETVFTPTVRGLTMTGVDDQGGASVACVGVMAHLAELAVEAGWSDASVSAFAASVQAYLATRTGFQAATGITTASFDGLLIDDTIARGTDPNAASVDAFGDEILSVLAAIGRYALEDGMPLDWLMDTARRVRAATPLRAAQNAPVDIIAGSNVDTVTEGVDLSVGRVATDVIVGTQSSNVRSTIDGAGVFGEIDVVAASGSASAIVTALSSQLRTFGISVGEDLASVTRGVPSLWVGDRVRVRDSDGAWANCAIVGATLAVVDGGGGVTIEATAAEGDW